MDKKSSRIPWGLFYLWSTAYPIRFLSPRPLPGFLCRRRMYNTPRGWKVHGSNLTCRRMWLTDKREDSSVLLTETWAHILSSMKLVLRELSIRCLLHSRCWPFGRSLHSFVIFSKRFRLFRGAVEIKNREWKWKHSPNKMCTHTPTHTPHSIQWSQVIGRKWEKHKKKKKKNSNINFCPKTYNGTQTYCIS